MGGGAKSVAELGSVLPHRDKWRVVVRLLGQNVYGPVRVHKAAADADLRLAQAAADRAGMAAVLERLKDDAAAARKDAAEELHKLEEEREDASALPKLMAENARLTNENAMLKDEKEEAKLKCRKLNTEIEELRKKVSDLERCTKARCIKEMQAEIDALKNPTRVSSKFTTTQPASQCSWADVSDPSRR